MSSNFSSSDALATQEPSTEQLTRLMENPGNQDETLSLDEIRQLLKMSHKNELSAYENLHTIGLGGFGSVYSAEEPELERKLALKILRPRYRQSKERIYAFIREARITAKIAHPNIVPVHRLGVFDDAGLYFSMKRVAGETLRAILKKLQDNRPGYRKRFPLPRLLDIFMGACQGVSYAHQNGILHCDLKPENIMVGDFGEVLVMDWGMAHYLDAPEEDPAGEKQDKHLGGTPVYMAPEHLSLISNEPTVRSDIYALGCVLYSILTRRTSPFEGAETLEEIQKRVVQEKIPPPRRLAPADQPVPRELESICLKAMARNPGKRYKSVNNLLADLQNYRDGLPVDAYSPSPVYKFGKFIFRRPLVPTVFFLSLLVWCGFSLYTVFNENIYAESLKINAANSFRNGEKRLLQARKWVAQLRKGTLNATQMQALENAIATESADAEADFKTPMDILERIPEKFRNPHNVGVVTGKIFRTLASYYNYTGNDEKLHNLALRFNNRWKTLFDATLKYFPDIAHAFCHALSGTGSIILTNPQALKWHIETERGTKITPADMQQITLPDKTTAFKAQLPIGLYTVVAQNSAGKTQRFPVYCSLTSSNRANLLIPEHLPENMIFIPGGEFNHTPDISNGFRRRSGEADFFIKATEVSVAEYLEFWKALKDENLKKLYASYYFDHKNSLHSSRSWDDNGKLLRKGLRPDHPVTGISGHAADAFCRYMSQKLKRKVTLPTRSQWSKAAGGLNGTEYSWGNTYSKGRANIDSAGFKPVGSNEGDKSLYGVRDLSGNVREFVKVTSTELGLNERFAIAGGSYYTLPAVARLSNITYSSRGGNDVGFRYVMAPEKNEKK